MIGLVLLASVLSAGQIAVIGDPAAQEWMDKRARLDEDAERLQIAYTNCIARLTIPSEDMVIPVETYPDGSVKLVIEAKYANLFDNQKFVWARDVVVRKFDEDGEEKTRLEAKECLVDRFSKSGWAQGDGKVTQGPNVFKGRNFYFSSPESFVISYEDSMMEAKEIKSGGLL